MKTLHWRPCPHYCPDEPNYFRSWADLMNEVSKHREGVTIDLPEATQRGTHDLSGVYVSVSSSNLVRSHGEAGARCEPKFEVEHQLVEWRQALGSEMPAEGGFIVDFYDGTKHHADLKRDVRIQIADTPVDTDLLVRFTQDPVGGHRVVWPENIKWLAGVVQEADPRPGWSTIFLIHVVEVGLCVECAGRFEP